jgi:hypothetical protein
MAVTFLGPKPGPCWEVRHLDGDPTNNRLSNLAWGTKGENTQDRKWHGKPRNQKLSPEQAGAAKALLSAGATERAVAAQFGIARSAAHWIRAGKYHRDV